MTQPPTSPRHNAPPPELVLATLADAPDGPPPPPSRPWVVRLVLAGLVALVFGPVLVLGWPGEIARWYEAAAIEKYLDDDSDGALAALDQALLRQPDSVALWLRRAQWKMEAQDHPGALVDCDRALELAPQDPAGQQLRAEALQHLGRHAEAVALWESLAAPFRDRTSMEAAEMLNAWAYARALGQLELPSALADIEQALKAFGTAHRVGVAQAAMLDTRGYIHLRLGDTDAAGADLDLAVEVVEHGLTAAERSRQYHDRREFLVGLRHQKKNLAVIRYHRALLNDRRGRPGEAAQDRRRVRELGFEPNDDLF